MLRAVIFDCDGVLADTEPLHWRAMVEVLRPRGVELTWDRYEETLLGMTDPEMFERVLREADRPHDAAAVERCVREKAVAFVPLLRNIRPMPGVVALIRRLAPRYPLAICSGAYRADIGTIVAALGVGDCFRLIVSCEDVERGKPDPQGYRLALQRLNEHLKLPEAIQAAECVAIEDSEPGVAAAMSAGMKVIRMSRSEDEKSHAVVANLKAVSDALLEAVTSSVCEEIALVVSQKTMTPADTSTSSLSWFVFSIALVVMVSATSFSIAISMSIILVAITATVVLVRRTQAGAWSGLRQIRVADNGSSARIQCTGRPEELLGIIRLRDTPFEPAIFPRTQVADLFSRIHVKVYVLAVPAAYVFCFVLAKFVNVTLQYFGVSNIRLDAGMFGALPMVMIGLAAYGIARLRPTYYRVVPGRLDILRYSALRAKVVFEQQIDLSLAWILVDFFNGPPRLTISHRDGGAIEIQLRDVQKPHQFAETVVWAAISTADSPQLPEGELIG